MTNLLLVDGSNLLFQMFYGMPARILGKRAQPIHGTLGFVGALLKMLRNLQPTHLAVLFDGACENPRKALDLEYKANRPDFSEMAEEETPFCQLLDIYAALDYLKIPHAETKCCEVDDWIAGYALKYGEKNRVIISSFDSDFFQLISDMVWVFRYRGEKSVLCDPAYVREKFGIEPTQYAEWKALVGDNADNIKGVRGVGRKTAATFLRRFGNMENLLKSVEEIERPALKKELEESRELLEKNLRLIRLSAGEKLPFSLEELVYCDKGLSSGEVLRMIGVT